MKDLVYKILEILSVIYMLLFLIGIIYGIFICTNMAIEGAFKDGYKEGAKDFYAGKIKVNLIENPDGTHEWKLIDNEKFDIY